MESYQKLYSIKVLIKSSKNRIWTTELVLVLLLRFHLFLSGLPAFLEVEPTSEEIAIENVHPVKFNVQILDKAKNVTSQPRLNVVCKVRFSEI